MSSNEQKPNLGDAKNLHKTSVSNEVVIRFSHVTCTRMTKRASWVSSTIKRRACSLVA